MTTSRQRKGMNRPDYICSHCWTSQHKNCTGTLRNTVPGGGKQPCLCRKCKKEKNDSRPN